MLFRSLHDFSVFIFIVYVITAIGQAGTYVLDAKEKTRNEFLQNVLAQEGHAKSSMSLATNGISLVALTICVLLIIFEYDDGPWLYISYLVFFVSGCVFFVGSCLYLNQDSISHFGDINEYKQYINTRAFLEFRKISGIVDENDYKEKFNDALSEQTRKYFKQRITFFVFTLPIYIPFVCLPAIALALALFILMGAAGARR